MQMQRYGAVAVLLSFILALSSGTMAYAEDAALLAELGLTEGDVALNTENMESVSDSDTTETVSDNSSNNLYTITPIGQLSTIKQQGLVTDVYPCETIDKYVHCEVINLRDPEDEFMHLFTLGLGKEEKNWQTINDFKVMIANEENVAYKQLNETQYLLLSTKTLPVGYLLLVMKHVS